MSRPQRASDAEAWTFLGVAVAIVLAVCVFVVALPFLVETGLLP